jgi:hypothetical protein
LAKLLRSAADRAQPKLTLAPLSIACPPDFQPQGSGLDMSLRTLLPFHTHRMSTLINTHLPTKRPEHIHTLGSAITERFAHN